MRRFKIVRGAAYRAQGLTGEYLPMSNESQAQGVLDVLRSLGTQKAIETYQKKWTWYSPIDRTPDDTWWCVVTLAEPEVNEWGEVCL